jgi:hypothetical protein
MKLYAIALKTIGSPEFTCTDDNGNPHLYTDEIGAWKEIADGMICCLQSFIDGDYEKDNAPFDGTDEFVVEVKIEKGKIISLSDEVDEFKYFGKKKNLSINK